MSLDVSAARPGHGAQAAPTVLEVRNMTRRFGGLVAVNDVSFSVSEGEIFGLIGPNGACKTTLFNLVTGLTKPSSGQLLHAGDDITGARPHEVARHGLARTFQNVRLFAELTAMQNVMIAQHVHTSAGLVAGVLRTRKAVHEERQAEEHARRLLQSVGLDDRAQVKARNFAYGDQRRLEIARALALQPKVLLLDEPAAGMNPTEKAGLSDFIRSVRESFELSVLLIEHHVPLVMGLCDRIAVLDFGNLIAVGDPSTVRDDPAVQAAYLGDE